MVRGERDLRTFILPYVSEYVSVPGKRQETTHRGPAIGFSDANDWLYRELKEVAV